MRPNILSHGPFSSQRMLSPSHPDHMRQVGYESDGGYPLEQAFWMAGRPNPDFMNLGGLNGYYEVPDINLGFVDYGVGNVGEAKMSKSHLFLMLGLVGGTAYGIYCFMKNKRGM